MSTIARIELHYLPSLEYFCALSLFEEIQLEVHAHYVKQSFLNRCYINTSQGMQKLIIPIREKHGKVAIHEIKIDYQQKWQTNHWRTIESAYRNAPFFEFYSDELKEILNKGYELLVDLNYELLSFCLRSIHLKVSHSKTTIYENAPDPLISDLRFKITPKQSFSNRTFYHPKAYQQVFGNDFVPNLTVLDLLFCEGPHAPSIIQSATLLNK